MDDPQLWLFRLLRRYLRWPLQGLVAGAKLCATACSFAEGGLYIPGECLLPVPAVQC